jgi:hypothetical protein
MVSADGAHHLDEVVARDQLDRLAIRKAARVYGVVANANHRDGVRAVMGQKTPHFAHRRHGYLPLAPALALDERSSTVFTEDEVDPAVCASLAGFLDCVASAAEGFAYQLLELTSVESGHAFQVGAGLQQPRTLAAAHVRHACGNPADGK